MGFFIYDMLLYATYFPSIIQFIKILKFNIIDFEIHANFKKQTYFNRCYIYGANGKQLLNIPIKKTANKVLIKDVQIDYQENWQKNHYKSLISAYKSSPFFEFYIDDLLFVFNKKETYLLDLNIKIFKIICELLQIEINFNYSKLYNKDVVNDYRFLVNSKSKSNYNLAKYRQVFSIKSGFLENLSVLDLLFNEGPNALLYLEKELKNFDFS